MNIFHSSTPTLKGCSWVGEGKTELGVQLGVWETWSLPTGVATYLRRLDEHVQPERTGQSRTVCNLLGGAGKPLFDLCFFTWRRDTAIPFSQRKGEHMDKQRMRREEHHLGCSCHLSFPPAHSFFFLYKAFKKHLDLLCILSQRLTLPLWAQDPGPASPSLQ